MKLHKKACAILGLSLLSTTNVLAEPIVQLNTSEINQNYEEYTGTIIIDAGHYYGEAGKRDPNGFGEIKYNLPIAKLVKEKIEKARPYVKVIESNPDGTNKGRGDRGSFAIEQKADLLFSLHMNHTGRDENLWKDDETGTTGSHIIVDDQANSETVEIAKNIITEYVNETGFPRHLGTGLEITENKVGMLDVASRGNTRAMLLEMGFMDHKEQSYYFRTEEGQDEISTTIANAIINNFIDVYIEKPEPKPLKIDEILESEEIEYLQSFQDGEIFQEPLEPTTEFVEHEKEHENEVVIEDSLEESLSMENANTSEEVPPLSESTENLLQEKEDLVLIEDVAESIENHDIVTPQENEITNLQHQQNLEHVVLESPSIEEKPLKEDVTYSSKQEKSFEEKYQEKLKETYALLEKVEKEQEELNAMTKEMETVIQVAGNLASLDDEILNEINELDTMLSNLK